MQAWATFLPTLQYCFFDISPFASFLLLTYKNVDTHPPPLFQPIFIVFSEKFELSQSYIY